jgi:hypothetical protein
MPPTKQLPHPGTPQRLAEAVEAEGWTVRKTAKFYRCFVPESKDVVQFSTQDFDATEPRTWRSPLERLIKFGFPVEALKEKRAAATTPAQRVSSPKISAKDEEVADAVRKLTALLHEYAEPKDELELDDLVALQGRIDDQVVILRYHGHSREWIRGLERSILPKGWRVQHSDATIPLTRAIRKQLLEASEENTRPLRKGVQERYATTMQRGAWRPDSPELISARRGEDGRYQLYQGRHRVSAADSLGGPVIAMRADLEMDPDLFNVLDTGASRSPADLLVIRSGGKISKGNAVEVMAISRLITNFDDDKSPLRLNRADLDNEQLVDRYQQEIDVDLLNEAMHAGQRAGQQLKVPKVGFAAGMYLARRAWPEAPHEEFVNGAVYGEGLKKRDPRAVWRDHMLELRMASKPSRMTSAQVTISYLRAWNAWMKEAKAFHRKKLYLAEGENTWPRPVTAPDPKLFKP